jgi:sulfate adenylyltransferase
VDTLRLADGTLFPIPITLDVSPEDVVRLSIVPGSRIGLRDPRDDQVLAIITGGFTGNCFLCNRWLTTLLVEDIYTPNLVKEAVQVFGADDPAHPSVAYLRNYVKDRYLGGNVQAIQSPTHFDYVALRCEPQVVVSPFSH